MICIGCGNHIEEDEEQYTTDDDGPYCDDCIEDAEAEAIALDFRDRA